jgi:hypothetical protein
MEEIWFVLRQALTPAWRREASFSSLYISEVRDVELYLQFLARVTL